MGSAIRRILLDASNQELHPVAELLLYFADRAQHVHQLILPALGQGKVVLCDRFTDSTLAYQGCARELGSEMVLALDHIASEGLTPDLTVLIDVDLETSLARAGARNRVQEYRETRMDQQSIEFHQKVRDAYRAIASQAPDRVRMIDGSGDVKTVARRVWEVVGSHV